MDITVSTCLAKGGASGIDVWCVEGSFGRNLGDVHPEPTSFSDAREPGSESPF